MPTLAVVATIAQVRIGGKVIPGFTQGTPVPSPARHGEFQAGGQFGWVKQAESILAQRLGCWFLNRRDIKHGSILLHPARTRSDAAAETGCFVGFENQPIIGFSSTLKGTLMIYKFKSKNTGDVIMLQPNGRKLLEIIGVDAGPQGIIQPAQMLAAIAAIQAAIAFEEAQDESHRDEAASVDGLGLRQRAVPFLDLLRRSQQSGDNIVWGV